MKLFNKNIKKLSTVLLIFVLILAATAFGNSEARSDEIKTAYSLGLISKELADNGNRDITRKEFCVLAVNFYRLMTGNEGITLSASPFVDERSGEVVFAVKNGILSGVTANTFVSSGTITNKEAITAAGKTFEICGIRTSASAPKAKYYKDFEAIPGELLNLANFLWERDIIRGEKGCLNPDKNMTVDNAAAMFVRAYNTFNVEEVCLNGKTLSFGELTSSVINKFGEPLRIDKTEFGTERYVYHESYNNLVIIGIKDNHVVEIFTNSDNFEFMGISSDDKYESISFSGFDKAEVTSALYSNDSYYATFYFSSNNELKADALYIKSKKLIAAKKYYTEEFQASTEAELFDLINSTRAKLNLNPVELCPLATEEAKEHSNDMLKNNYLDYVDTKGRSPFNRMDAVGIKYYMAAENIAGFKGNAIDIYNQWMYSAGTRSNLLNPDITHAGIGCSVGSFIVYTTMDMYSPK